MRKIIDFDSREEVTSIDHLVGMISKTAFTQERTSAYSMSNRVPLREYTLIKTLAEYSGKSVNQVVVHLLRVALDELFKALPAEDYDKIQELYATNSLNLHINNIELSENYKEGF